jgi:hypothetical protein
MLHRKRLLREMLRNFDWIGLVLYTGSLTVFLLGLNCGGLLYPWDNSHTISGLVIGGVGLFIIFPLWEISYHSQVLNRFSRFICSPMSAIKLVLGSLASAPRRTTASPLSGFKQSRRCMVSNLLIVLERLLALSRLALYLDR